VCAAASPPTQFPAQYSPALPWGTTRFGMELGGSMALWATHTPQTPDAPKQMTNQRTTTILFEPAAV
jgi:hypothetical protein